INAVQVRSNGEFRIVNLPAGTYKLFTSEALDTDPLTFNPRGQLFGYPPIFFPAASDFASAATIDLEPGQTFQASLTPVRQPYYPVKIPIHKTWEDGFVDVVILPNGRRAPGFSLGYDPQQNAITGSLPKGNYTIEAATEPATYAGLMNINVAGRV